MGDSTHSGRELLAQLLCLASNLSVDVGSGDGWRRRNWKLKLFDTAILGGEDRECAFWDVVELHFQREIQVGIDPIREVIGRHFHSLKERFNAKSPCGAVNLICELKASMETR